ncbi:hypothetical protein B0H10DRAFT_2053477 [Mycena sp. CBHHK59/15]|nr:hypothetical protein B0H10DRAFT_2053477 [Mycena sp. CBHHK59/15]
MSHLIKSIIVRRGLKSSCGQNAANSDSDELKYIPLEDVQIRIKHHPSSDLHPNPNYVHKEFTINWEHPGVIFMDKDEQRICPHWLNVSGSFHRIDNYSNPLRDTQHLLPSGGFRPRDQINVAGEILSRDIDAQTGEPKPLHALSRSGRDDKMSREFTWEEIERILNIHTQEGGCNWFEVVEGSKLLNVPPAPTVLQAALAPSALGSTIEVVVSIEIQELPDRSSKRRKHGFDYNRTDSSKQLPLPPPPEASAIELVEIQALPDHSSGRRPRGHIFINNNFVDVSKPLPVLPPHRSSETLPDRSARGHRHIMHTAGTIQPGSSATAASPPPNPMGSNSAMLAGKPKVKSPNLVRNLMRASGKAVQRFCNALLCY